MSITVTTHLNLHGTAREALEFYLSVFGGESTITTYGDLGMPADAPDAGRVVSTSSSDGWPPAGIGTRCTAGRCAATGCACERLGAAA